MPRTYMHEECSLKPTTERCGSFRHSIHKTHSPSQLLCLFFPSCFLGRFLSCCGCCCSVDRTLYSMQFGLRAFQLGFCHRDCFLGGLHGPPGFQALPRLQPSCILVNVVFWGTLLSCCCSHTCLINSIRTDGRQQTGSSYDHRIWAVFVSPAPL